jgi:ribulose-phosphate 3-epimerase
MKYIAPSILSADFSRLGDEIRAVETAGADWIHVDVMDGHFVPNITIGPLGVRAARKVTRLPLDVHLMIENPDASIPAFAEAGADWLSVQVEACVHLDRSVRLIRDCGARPGVVLNPATGLSAVEWVLGEVDLVTLMSVNPGFGGQAFIPKVLDKARALRARLDETGRTILMAMDGGINETTIADASAAGVDVFVAGSAVFESGDYAKSLRRLRRLMG